MQIFFSYLEFYQLENSCFENFQILNPSKILSYQPIMYERTMVDNPTATNSNTLIQILFTFVIIEPIENIIAKYNSNQKIINIPLLLLKTYKTIF